MENAFATSDIPFFGQSVSITGDNGNNRDSHEWCFLKVAGNVQNRVSKPKVQSGDTKSRLRNRHSGQSLISAFLDRVFLSILQLLSKSIALTLRLHIRTARLGHRVACRSSSVPRWG